MARARIADRDLKIPDPNEHGFGAQLHHQRGVGRRATAPRADSGHRQLALAGDRDHEYSLRSAQLLGGGEQLLRRRASHRRISPTIARR